MAIVRFRRAALIMAGCLAVFVGLASLQSARGLWGANAAQQGPNGRQGAGIGFDNPIISALSRLLDEEEDIEDADRDSALDILVEADSILSDIKQENAQALEDLRQPIPISRGNSRRLAE